MKISVKHFMQMKLVSPSITNGANPHQCVRAAALSFLQEADAYEVRLNRIILWCHLVIIINENAQSSL